VKPEEVVKPSIKIVGLLAPLEQKKPKEHDDGSVMVRGASIELLELFGRHSTLAIKSAKKTPISSSVWSATSETLNGKSTSSLKTSENSSYQAKDRSSKHDTLIEIENVDEAPLNTPRRAVMSIARSENSQSPTPLLGDKKSLHLDTYAGDEGTLFYEGYKKSMPSEQSSSKSSEFVSLRPSYVDATNDGRDVSFQQQSIRKNIKMAKGRNFASNNDIMNHNQSVSVIR